MEVRVKDVFSLFGRLRSAGIVASLVLASLATSSAPPAGAAKTSQKACDVWRRVTVPRATELRFSDVAAVSAGDVWVAAHSTAGPLLLHWNGRRWKRVAVPTGTPTVKAHLV